MLGSPHHSTGVEGLAACGDWSWLQKLNGADASGMELGCPGPLGSMCHSVTARAINCQPSPRLTRLALSWACFPTQQMAPDRVNAAPHALPKLSPSPNNHCP